MEVKKQKTFLQYLSDAVGIWGAVQVGKHFAELIYQSGDQGTQVLGMLVIAAILLSLGAETSAWIRGFQFVPTFFIFLIWIGVLQYPNDPSNSSMIIFGRVMAWVLVGINFIDVGEWIFDKLGKFSNWLSTKVFKPLKEKLNKMRDNGP